MKIQMQEKEKITTKEIVRIVDFVKDNSGDIITYINTYPNTFIDLFLDKLETKTKYEIKKNFSDFLK